jgi:hypothetical protein
MTLLTFLSQYPFLYLFHDGNILCMAGQVGRHFAPDRTIEQIEITDQVENLMPDKLIRKS